MVFSEKFGNTTHAVYTDLETVDSLINMNSDTLTEFIHKKGKYHFSDSDSFRKLYAAHIACLKS